MIVLGGIIVVLWAAGFIGTAIYLADTGKYTEDQKVFLTVLSLIFGLLISIAAIGWGLVWVTRGSVRGGKSFLPKQKVNLPEAKVINE